VTGMESIKRVMLSPDRIDWVLEFLGTPAKKI
jgi:hypothetical protein